MCSVALFTVTLSMAREGSNITSCNIIPGSSPTTCNQGPCVKWPCAMQCGHNSPYESCQQHCDRSICDAINCTASQTCNQTCQGGRCEELTCNAPNCFQDCNLSICNKMICPMNTVKCVQSASAKELICEARLCDQRYAAGFGNATCSSEVKTCNQLGERGIYNTTCAPGVETCTQTFTAGQGIMRCDADVCKQNCTNSQCDMICSSSVKECYQYCGPAGTAICRLTCEADKCKPDCPVKRGRVGCTFLNYNTPNKNDAPSANHVSAIYFMIVQSFIFTIKYL